MMKTKICYITDRITEMAANYDVDPWCINDENVTIWRTLGLVKFNNSLSIQTGIIGEYMY